MLLSVYLVFGTKHSRLKSHNHVELFANHLGTNVPICICTLDTWLAFVFLISTTMP